MQPHWHVAFINKCFKESSCFGLTFSSFYVTKGKTLEGNISIYSMVVRLQDFAVPQGGYCLQTALKYLRQYFILKGSKKNAFDLLLQKHVLKEKGWDAMGPVNSPKTSSSWRRPSTSREICLQENPKTSLQCLTAPCWKHSWFSAPFCILICPLCVNSRAKGSRGTEQLLFTSKLCPVSCFVFINTQEEMPQRAVLFNVRESSMKQLHGKTLIFYK